MRRRRDFTALDPEADYTILGVQRSGWGFVEREPIKGRDQKFTKLMRVEEDNLVYRTITAFEAPSAVAGADEDGLFVTPQTFPVFRIDESVLLAGYMRLLTTWPGFHEEMASRCTGTVLRRKTLSIGAFESIPVNLPPLAEQRRIVDLIGTLDDTIASAAVARGSARKAAVAVIDRHWEPSVLKVPVDTAITFMLGGTWGSPSGEGEVDVRALGPRSYVGRLAVDVSTATPRSLSSKRAADRTLQGGDIVLERSGGTATQPVGRVIRMTATASNVVPSDFQRLLRPDPAVVDPGYLFWHLWAAYEAGRTVPFQKATTNIRNLNIPEYLARTTIALPSMETQRGHADLADSFASTLERNEAAMGALLALRSNLLTALVSGEHEMPESYDELIEEVPA